jgi:hypothetical protein
MKKSIVKLIKRNKSFSSVVSLVLVGIIAIVGYNLLSPSHAESPYGNVYVANGTIKSPAQLVSGGSNSNGDAVKFTAAVATPSPSPSPSPSSNGYVTASGTNLMLNGNVTHFIGFDAYGMEGCYNGTAWTTAQLDTYFAGLPANGLTRIWADEVYGTSVIANIIAQAAKYNQHLVLSIANDDGNCDPTPDDPTSSSCSNNPCGEPLSFYQGAGVSGSAWSTTYVGWVDTIVPMFANDPTVAMWEISNEPGNSASVPTATMETYLTDSAEAIRKVDPNQLIESGFNYPGNANDQSAGTAADYEQIQSSPYINVISLHDYIWDYYLSTYGQTYAINNPESSDFPTAQAAATEFNKPFIVGETGVESGPTCTSDLTESQRVNYLENKTNDYFEGKNPNGGTGPAAGAVMYWEYEPANSYGWSNGQCEYDLFPPDPLISMVQNYQVPN